MEGNNMLSLVRLHRWLGPLLLAEQGLLPRVVHGAPREQRLQIHLRQVSNCRAP